jgi:hypothetical protein
MQTIGLSTAIRWIRTTKRRAPPNLPTDPINGGLFLMESFRTKFACLAETIGPVGTADAAAGLEGLRI